MDIPQSVEGAAFDTRGDDRTHVARRLLNGLDRILGAALEATTAVLLLAEIVMLTITVSARYFFKAPATAVEELATLIFLWLGMLGVVCAARRGTHLRLSFVLSLLSPPARARLEAAADVIVIGFMVLLIPPALQLAELNHLVSSPVLGLPGSVAALATLTSFVLTIAALLVRLANTLDGRSFLLAVAGAACLPAALLFLASVSGGPPMAGLGNINLLVFFAILVPVLVVLSVPIAFAFGMATVGYLLLTTNLPLMVIVGRINEGMSQFLLLTIPLFIFLGYQLQESGMARRMVDFFVALLGSKRGGLGYVQLCTMYLVSGISGAKAADMAAIGPILAPAMKERGTREGDIAALLAISAAAAETIPPSLVLIIVGSVTAVSIQALFTGGLLPAVICMGALAIVVFVRSRSEPAKDGRFSPALVVRTFLAAIPVLILPLIIRAAVLEGIATATEVATIGIAYVLVVGAVMRRGIPLRRLASMLVDTATISGALLIIVALAGAMSWALTQSGFANVIVAVLTNLPGGKFTFFVVSIVLFAIFGSILEGIAAIVLFGPLLFPIAAAVGIHEVHYAIVILLSMGLGLFAPPFGYGFYAACAITQVSPDRAITNVFPYLGALATAIALIAAFPWLSVGFLE